jgi:hypothetical protein
VLGLLVLFGVALYFTYLTVRPDLGLVEGGGESDDAGRAKWRERLAQGWLGQEAEEVRGDRRMKRVAPALALLFAVVFSMISYDWIMSLEPHWYSTLFGAWFFMGAFWGGAALTAVATVWLKGQDPDFDRMMGVQQLHDLGKLIFGFVVFWAYIAFSQYMLIWYANLPEETLFFVPRSSGPWAMVSVSLILFKFIVPFLALLSRKAKRNPAYLSAVAVLILVMQAVDIHWLVYPNLNEEHVIVGIDEIGVF